MVDDLWVCHNCFSNTLGWPCLPIPFPCLFPQDYAADEPAGMMEKSIQLVRHNEISSTPTPRTKTILIALRKLGLQTKRAFAPRNWK